MNAEVKWAFEDEFQMTGCFVNGLTGKVSHIDAYMTVMDFDKVDEVFNEVKEKYSDDLNWILKSLIESDHVMQRLLGIHLKEKE